MKKTFRVWRKVTTVEYRDIEISKDDFGDAFDSNDHETLAFYEAKGSHDDYWTFQSEGSSVEMGRVEELGKEEKKLLSDAELDDAYLLACQVGLNLDPYNDEQITAIMKPLWAPEDFYQDGEISQSEAIEYHVKELNRLNVYSSDISKALRLI